MKISKPKEFSRIINQKQFLVNESNFLKYVSYWYLGIHLEIVKWKS